MLRFAFCLLIARSAFAVNPYPIEAESYGPVGPNTNLVYNFEQIRRDQPPHIELREENINKYRNRPRTTPKPEISSYPIDDRDMSPMKPQHPLPYNAKQWTDLQQAPKYDGPVQAWKSVPAPPNFPHWDSLSSKAVTNPNNYQSQPAIPQQPIVVPSEEPVQWSEPVARSRASIPSYSPPMEQAQWNEEEFRGRAPVQDYTPPMSTATPTFAPTYAPTYAPTMAPMRQAPTRHISRGNPASSRGSHRFNWDEAMQSEPSSTPVPNRMPPPAVPTLSPWHDGF